MSAYDDFNRLADVFAEKGAQAVCLRRENESESRVELLIIKSVRKYEGSFNGVVFLDNGDYIDAQDIYADEIWVRLSDGKVP